jgi:subtilase family serine protease
MTHTTGYTRLLNSLSVVAALTLASFASSSHAASIAPRQLITAKVDDAHMITLHGNTRSEANAKNDLGQVADSLPMEHMLLQLKRAPESQAAFDKYTEELTDRTSPNYHKWLTAAQIGSRYGLAAADVEKVTGWLGSHGLKINTVYPNHVMVDFSGTAAQVRETFQTEIHSLDVKGVRHIANYSDPKIPAALEPAVVGVVSLNDFRPHQMHKQITSQHVNPKNGSLVPAAAQGNYTFTSSGNTYQAVVPADLATIYNLTPLFKAGYTGKGQTIVVIEDSNVFRTSDWTTFRSTFGLSSYTSGTFTQVHPGSCTNPGIVVGTDGEAILDAEWASAAAPNAAIQLASCADTLTTFGGLIALENLLNASSTPPAIVSISYGECEAENGASANAAYSSTYQQAASEGVSVFVSSGDEGAASCDANQSKATHGIGVSGFASTPYNVAVGGTDFMDTYNGTNSNYWNTTNTSTYGSAKSYIPEIPWNDSCASALIASYTSGSSVAYGSSGFCNSSTGEADYLTTASGSGGPSGCATGAPSTSGLVSGTCKGYAKPSWQSGLANVPSDGVRDIPDVSLFAANGVWGHYYVFCYTDVAGGGAPCTGAPSGWAGAGGTSFASPIVAAIQSLVNQKTGERQGNPNPTYYQLAKTEYGTATNSHCYSINANVKSNACIFYDVTKGDMDVNCTGTHSCYLPSGKNGVLSTSTTSFVPAYLTHHGYDFATGIGTLNAYNLVYGW